MKLYFLGITTAFFLIPLSMQAQQKRVPTKKDIYNQKRRASEAVALHFSAGSNFNLYSAKIGAEIPLKIVEKREGNVGGERFFRETYITADAGWYRRYSGVSIELPNIDVSLMFRKVNGGSGIFWQYSPVGLGASYGLRFAKDTMPSVPAQKRFYATPSVSFGLGRDFAFVKRRQIPLVLFAKADIGAFIPIQKAEKPVLSNTLSATYLNTQLTLGLSYRIVSWRVDIRRVRKS